MKERGGGKLGKRNERQPGIKTAHFGEETGAAVSGIAAGFARGFRWTEDVEREDNQRVGDAKNGPGRAAGRRARSR